MSTYNNLLVSIVALTVVFTIVAYQLWSFHTGTDGEILLNIALLFILTLVVIIGTFYHVKFEGSR